MACKIQALQTEGKIVLKPNHFNNLGNNPYDGAAALDNIKDTCAGKMAKRLETFLKVATTLVDLILIVLM